MDKKRCVFAGSFDPPTLGHKAVVESALTCFDEVVIALLVNPQKTPYFNLEQRLDMLQADYGKMQGVRIVVFDGTVAELMKKENIKTYVRGIRNTVDFEFEQANYFATQKLDKSVRAVYIPCPQELLHVSSSMVRNSLAFSTPIDEYVSKQVKDYIEKLD